MGRRIETSEVGAILRELRGASPVVDQLLTEPEIRRITATINLIPPAGTHHDELVDIGATMFWLPLYSTLLGYRRVTFICRAGAAWENVFPPERFGVCLRLLHLNAELDPYPIDSESISCACAFEILEHFAGDPMHMLSEINRILRPDGALRLSTPNVLNREAALRYLFGGHPFGWSPFTYYWGDRHNREYTPGEVSRLLGHAGFFVELLQTHDYAKPRRPLLDVLEWMVCVPGAVVGRVPFSHRRHEMLVAARKVTTVLERYPAEFYALYGFKAVRMPPGLRREEPPLGASNPPSLLDMRPPAPMVA